MTRQQAGVSAEAVGKLVAKWNEASDQARNKIVALMFEGCARELEAALAIAPPEQAAPMTTKTAEDIPSGEGWIYAKVEHVTEDGLIVARHWRPLECAPLNALVAKWRSEAETGSLRDAAHALGRCAKELETALATAPPEQAQPAKSTLPVGVSVLVTNGELVLLGERINNTASGLLSTPGGRVEQNEDIFACAVRETQEETGLSLTRDLLKVIAWREHFRFGQHYFMFYVHAPQSFGTVVNKEPDKCKAWGWRTISQIKVEETTEPLDILALLVPPDQPQAASGGARSPNDEIHFQEGRLLGLTEGMHKCEELLAAHNQKVRAEVLANILPVAISEAWHDGYQDGIADGAPYPSQQDIDELQRRILAAPAASKPEGGKGEISE